MVRNALPITMRKELRTPGFTVYYTVQVTVIVITSQITIGNNLPSLQRFCIQSTLLYPRLPRPLLPLDTPWLQGVFCPHHHGCNARSASIFMGMFCQHYHSYNAGFVSISMVEKVLLVFPWLPSWLCQYFHGYGASFASISVVTAQALPAFPWLQSWNCQYLHGYKAYAVCTLVPSPPWTFLLPLLWLHRLSVFSCQVFLGLSCCLRHFLARPVLQVLGTIVVWRHLQEPLVLDLNRLQG